MLRHVRCVCRAKTLHVNMLPTNDRNMQLDSSTVSAITTQSSEFVARQVTEGTIDFSVGQPSPLLLPLEKVAAAAQARLAPSSDSALLLQYGPAQGYRSFRAALAKFLSRYYKYQVDPDCLMTVAGVSHGLDLVCGNLTQPGDVILVEQPTYHLAQRIFDVNHLRVQPVPTDEGGVDTSWLETWLGSNQGTRPRLLYTVPLHNNPQGTTLTASRRRHLVELAHRYQFYLVCDEVYQLLTFPGKDEPPAPMRWFEQLVDPSHPSWTISLGSFSKIFAPGLRLGWIEASAGTIKVLKEDGVLHSGGCVASLATGIAHSALDMGLLQEHLEEAVRPSLSERCSALCSALRSQMPDCLFLEPQGGYFVWLQLPDNVDATKLLVHADRHHKVRFTPGTLCGGASNCIRLSFAFYTPAELQEGVQRLAAALASCRHEPASLAPRQLNADVRGAAMP